MDKLIRSSEAELIKKSVVQNFRPTAKDSKVLVVKNYVRLRVKR